MKRKVLIFLILIQSLFGLAQQKLYSPLWIYSGVNTTVQNSFPSTMNLSFNPNLELGYNFIILPQPPKNKPRYYHSAIGIHLIGASLGLPTWQKPAGISLIPIANKTTSTSVNTQGSFNTKGMYKAGAGPQYSLFLGNNMMLAGIMDVGFIKSTFKDTFSQFQQSTAEIGQGQFTDAAKIIFKQEREMQSGLFYQPRLRLHYMFGRIGLWAEGSYFSNPKIKTTTSTLLPNGQANGNGEYHIEDFIESTNYDIKTTEINNTGVEINGGIVVTIGKPKSPKIPNPELPIISKQKPTVGTLNPGNPTTPPIATPTPHGKVKDKTPDDIIDGISVTVKSEKRKQEEEKKCGQFISPANGSTISNDQEIVIKVSEPSKENKEIQTTLYKVSNDITYWDKPENFAKSKVSGMGCGIPSFDEDAKKVGFEPMNLKMKMKNGIFEYNIPAKTLKAGAYILVAQTSCGATSAAFVLNNCDQTLEIRNVQDICLGYVNGGFKHKICFDSYYRSNLSNLTFTQPGTGIFITDLLNNPIPYTQISGFPLQTQAISAIGTTVNYCLEIIVPIGVNTIDLGIQGDDKDPSPTYTCAPSSHGPIELKICICDFCDKTMEFDNNAPTNIRWEENHLHIHQDIWANGPANVQLVGAKAEIVYFRRELDDVCMPCNKNSNEWGNIINGTFSGSVGTFNPTNNNVSGSTQHSIYFYNGINNATGFDLNISVPPTSPLSCCCEKIYVGIRYTHIFKEDEECKMCSGLYEYEIKKGDCPLPPKPDGPKPNGPNPRGPIGDLRGTPMDYIPYNIKK